jgi:outer membrane protein OmpA-like peptidoglycan-associated protein
VRYSVCVFCILLCLPLYAEFNRTTRMIDVPTADILPHMGFRLGLDGSLALGSGTRNDDADWNFHSSLGLFDAVELYADIYTFENFTMAFGFSHRFFQTDKISIAWGIHQISYAKDISEIGHGDSTGWYDDLTYYRGDYDKPFELGSAYLVSSYEVTKSVKTTIGLGRGRYCGYGTHSQYFNSNFYHDQGGDWGIGLIAGIELQITKDLSFMLEGDSRDLNTGLKFKKTPIEIGIAWTKFEFAFWPDGGEFDPRIAASISYVQDKKKEKPEPGIIAGVVTDEKGNFLGAGVGLVQDPGSFVNCDQETGKYKLGSIDPGAYEVRASLVGYETASKKVEVFKGEITQCDFVLHEAIIPGGMVSGMVIDIKTEEPLVSTLTITQTNNTVSSDKDGAYAFDNIEPGNYEIKAEADEYETGFYPVEVFSGETTEVVIEMVKRQTVITLEGINFDFGKSDIKSMYYPILDKGGKILIAHPDIRVEIQGYADSVGTDEVNMELSVRRAEAVREYLIDKFDIDPARLSSHGYGETRPIAPNDTEENRAKNRRVDFVIF